MMTLPSREGARKRGRHASVVALGKWLFEPLRTYRHQLDHFWHLYGSTPGAEASDDLRGPPHPMTSPTPFPFRAQAEVQRILTSRMFRTGCNDIDTAEHLRYAIRHVTLQGLWLEFGVGNGASLKVIAEQTRAQLYGFDSFEGLPEDWVRGEGRPTLPRGSFRGSPKVVPAHVTLVPGLFVDTLPHFLEKNSEVVAFMHVDCDIYTSTQAVLSSLRHKLAPGTVIVFDELFNYPNFADHEMRALLEAAAEQGLEYEYLGYVDKCFPASSAASLKVTGVRSCGTRTE